MLGTLWPESAGLHLLVLALSTQQPSLLLRVAASGERDGLGGSSGSSGSGRNDQGVGVEEGDYLYEFPSLPSAAAVTTAAGGAGGARGGGGGGLAAAGAQVACLALSDDGGQRLLCVTREGNAQGLRTDEVLRAATRVFDDRGDDGDDDDEEVEGASGVTGGDEAERGRRRRQQRRRHPWRTSPFGPSLLDHAMDPRYHREASSSAAGGGAAAGMGHGRRAKDISLGSNSTEGDFEPRCCIWWTPAVASHAGGRLPASNMAIIGGAPLRIF